MAGDCCVHGTPVAQVAPAAEGRQRQALGAELDTVLACREESGGRVRAPPMNGALHLPSPALHRLPAQATVPHPGGPAHPSARCPGRRRSARHGPRRGRAPPPGRTAGCRRAQTPSPRTQSSSAGTAEGWVEGVGRVCCGREVQWWHAASTQLAAWLGWCSPVKMLFPPPPPPPPPRHPHLSTLQVLARGSQELLLPGGAVQPGSLQV